MVGKRVFSNEGGNDGKEIVLCLRVMWNFKIRKIVVNLSIKVGNMIYLFFFM